MMGQTFRRGFKVLIGFLVFGWMFFGAGEFTQAAVSFQQGYFIKSASTSSVDTITTNFQPLAVIFYWTRQTAAGFNGTSSFGVGFSDGTDHRSVSSESDDLSALTAASSTTNTSRVRSTSSIVFLDPNATAGSNATIGAYATTTFTSTTFSVGWNMNNGRADIVQYVAIGGADITSSSVGTFLLAATTTDQSFTPLGFQPDFLMFLHSNTSIATGTISGVSGIGIGFAASTTVSQQGALTASARDARTTSDVGQTMRIEQAIAIHSTFGNSLDALATVKSFDATGFTLAVSDAPFSAVPINYIALKGGQHQVGNFLQATSTVSSTVAGLAFQPVGLMVWSADNTSSSATVTGAPAAKFSLGAAQSSTVRGSIWSEDIDAADPQVTNNYQSTSSVIAMASTTTMLAEADFSAFASSSFTLSWTTADSTERQMGYWVVGSNPVPTYEQSAFRWFKNGNGTAVGAALGSQDASTTITSASPDFRLRMLLHVGTATSTAGTDIFKLQVATSTPGGCDPSYSGETYVDVSSSTGDIRYKNNTTPADNALLTSSADDPTHGGDSIVNQTYEEENNFTVTSTISAGADGKWDFALTNTAAPGSTYCFRTVFSSSTLITTSTATKIPELTTTSTIMILFEGASSTIPNGWRCLSCTDDDPFINVFPRASSTYANASSGVDAVTHNLTGATVAAGAGVAFDNAGSGLPAESHTHTWGNATTTSSSTVPLNVGLLVIGSLGATTTIPRNAIGIFDVSSSSLPANWDYYSPLEGRYLRGIQNVSSTGGTGNHSHSATTLSGTSDNTVGSAAGAGSVAASHTHELTSTLATASNTPPYIQMVFAKLNATGTVSNGLIAMFSTTSLPVNWSIVSTSGSAYAGRLLFGGQTFGGTGGSDSHNHGGSVSSTSGVPSLTTTVDNFIFDVGSASPTHTHVVTYTVSSASSTPVFRDVIIGKFTTPNSAPTVSSVSLNGGSNIVLTPNATTSVNVNATITDSDGCADINNGTTTIMIYRSAITSSTCLTTANDLNCYRLTDFTASSTCSASAKNTTTTFGVQYFANATDASSSFAAQNWLATVIFKDANAATGTADSSGVELLTLTALNITTSSINYGTITASSTSGSVNQTTTITNAGNSSTTLQLSANSTLTKGTDSIATGSQRYSTSSFIFAGTSTALTASPVTVSGFFLTSPTSTTSVAQTTFWGLTVPAGTATGTYSGVNLFTSLFQN